MKNDDPSNIITIIQFMLLKHRKFPTSFSLTRSTGNSQGRIKLGEESA
jgi:hypothetical protein